MPVILYPAESQQPDGTFTVLQGKAPGRIKFFLPRRETVQVTVYDSMTTLRSSQLTLRRR
jgi:hypothetical protein